MADALASSSNFLHGIGLRQVRLACGLVLFAYLLSHFANHSLGNISLSAMEQGLFYHTLVWQSLPVAVAFYVAALAHMFLGMLALYERRQFRWKAIEATQLIFGLSIPLLIVSHVIGMRLSGLLFDQQRTYPQAFFGYWVYRPYLMWMLLAALIVSWVHGCIGIYFWLRLKPYFKKISSYLLAAAVILPTLAMLGLYQGGRAVVRASASPEWQAENLSREKVGTNAQQLQLELIHEYFLWAYAGLIALVFVARGARALLERRGGLIKLSYGDGKSVRVPIGLSVLEASMRNHIAHSSACGGRARCSTCRIRIVGDCKSLPEPSLREAFVLERVGAGGDPAIRLACQLRPKADLLFFQIFPAISTAGPARTIAPANAGQERYLVSMFVDMRGSTKLAEKLLPFDTVFIINRFLTAVSQAVIESGGQPNQFVGDGQLALFGLVADPKTACRQAIEAAARIAFHVDELNRFLGNDVPEPIRFGIGIHGGEVIIGDIGSHGHMVFTALGDPVNVTARLQDMSKSFSCEVVISEEVCGTSELALDFLPQHEVAVRGRGEPIKVRTAEKAASLAGLAEPFADAAA